MTATLDANFDGIFLIASATHDLPQAVERRLKEERHRIVCIIYDLTHLDIPCVEWTWPEHIDVLVEHLVSLGHKNIDCINTQPLDWVIEGRMEQWKRSIEARGLKGTLHNHPVKPYEFPHLGAMSFSREWFDKGLPECTGIICTTTAAAEGVMRAAHEKNIRIGKDISLCVCDSTADMAQLHIPSLTTLVTYDRVTPLVQGLEWIVTGGRNWNRSLKLGPEEIHIWQGESTGPARI